MRSFTSETFIIWTQNFLAQNTSNMRFSQKNEVTSLKVFSIKKIQNLKLEMNTKKN